MAGVYISYPFCAQKCSYCNFASGVLPRELERDYVRAVVAELGAHTWQWTPETVYVGGGTPSRMETADLAEVLGGVPGRPWREATIEAAPGTVTAEKVAAWRDLGINRISLGAQSFVRAELARTGRKHAAETVAAEIGLLRGQGIASINVDLIAGLPGQTPESWNESLGWIERLDLPHVSVYLLEVDEDSRLGLEVLNHGGRYGARDVPPDEAMAEMYEIAVERLARMGIERYEISNFARPGWESLHNLKYWTLEPYAGFGADAHSFDGTTRRANVERAREYMSRVLAGEPAGVSVTAANIAEERFFVGLRLARGIEPAPEEWQRHAAAIERFVREGMLARDGGRIRLTAAGVLLSNEVLQEFVNP